MSDSDSSGLFLTQSTFKPSSSSSDTDEASQAAKFLLELEDDLGENKMTPYRYNETLHVSDISHEDAQ